MTDVREPLLRHLLGDLLRRLRQEQGRTLLDVAREAQISMPYLSEVERGLKEVSSEVLAAICRALGVTLLDLLERAALEHAQPVLVHDLRSQHGFAPPGMDVHGSSGGGAVSLLAA